MRSTTPIERVVWFLLCSMLGVGLASNASSQPEKIRPGHSHYSDELAESTNQGLVRSIGREKNYEEVYQLYTYYEFVYDEGKRVALFREYKRGEVVRTEKYTYDDSGSLTLRVVSRPGKDDVVTAVEAAGANPPLGPRNN